jgi:uncharacterized protein YlxW (UPF0749 family)
MKFFLAASALLFFNAVSAGAGQSPDPASQAGADTAKSTQQPAGTAPDNVEKPKKKPKKVWTNDEISSAGGPGSISVVGNPSDADTTSSSKDASAKTTSASSLREKRVGAYRDRLHQLHNEMEATDKKISELRNFKADNTSSSGGINMNHRYSMTPLEDQVKSLEEKKKQLQAQIDAVEDEARKNGVEPGQLR